MTVARVSRWALIWVGVLVLVGLPAGVLALTTGRGWGLIVIVIVCVPFAVGCAMVLGKLNRQARAREARAKLRERVQEYGGQHDSRDRDGRG